MIQHASSLVSGHGAGTHAFHLRRATLPMRTRDHIRSMTARSWRLTGVSRKKLGAALHIDPTNAGRRYAGESPRSALSSLAEERLALELAGVSAAFMETRWRIMKEYPELMALSLPELQELLDRENEAELAVDHAADAEQWKSLTRRGDVLGLRDAAEAHAAKLIRIAAICEVINLKCSGGPS